MTEFPSPGVDDERVRHNLPVQLSSFVGRELELAEVQELVAEGRLVTLLGPGGSGKTRMALQLAERLTHCHPDGVWWVDLAGLDDAAVVPDALAEALGVRESRGRRVTDAVADLLRARRTLVLLDNCEHLVEACSTLVAELLHRCADLTVLATSREPLAVSGETTWWMPPLSEHDAADLFAERARSARPGFVLTPANEHVVAEICQRLDALPLAIELAAARTRMLTVEEIATGLTDRFGLLSRGTRTALPRHRTLEASVDWSHAVLEEDERVVFRRLAVFPGSFTLDAAESVCAGQGIDRSRIVDLLGVLVDRSLVQAVDYTGPHSRHQMLETIREYAARRLADSGNLTQVRERHLGFYLAFSEQAATASAGSDLGARFDAVTAELPNVRAALDWSPTSADPDRGLRLISGLSAYWIARGALGVGIARLERAIESGAEEGTDRAGALVTMCLISYARGAMAEASRYADDAVALARRTADAGTLGRALGGRAIVRCWGEDRRLEAWADFEEADPLLDQPGSQYDRAFFLAMFGISLTESSAATRARGVLTTALSLVHGDSSTVARMLALGDLGALDIVEGDLDSAADHLVEALRLTEQIGDHLAHTIVRRHLALLELVRGQLAHAREHCRRAVAVSEDVGAPVERALAQQRLSMVELAAGDLDSAVTELQSSWKVLADGRPGIAAFGSALQAQLAALRGDAARASRYAAEALTAGRESDTVAAIVWALHTQAILARLGGDPHVAENHCHDAIDLLERAGHRIWLCDALDVLGGAAADQERWEESARLLAAAQKLRDIIGYVRFPSRQPSYDADVAAVRDRIGTDRFETARAEGAALGVGDVIAYARRGRAARKRPSFGWESLTPTELQVVELVVDGLTNAQVGRKLFISPRTVQTHLSHVFTKLGVGNRTELATARAERSTPPS